MALSGFELSGASVTMTFSDLQSFSNQLFRKPFSQFASEAIIDGEMPAAPSLSFIVAPTAPAVVFSSPQTVQIMGAPGATIRLIGVEGALQLAEVPGGGFDIDPFEINTAIQLQETELTLDPTGTAEIDVTLSNSVSEGGYNYFFATTEDAQDRTGAISNVAILKLVTNCSKKRGATMVCPASARLDEPAFVSGATPTESMANYGRSAAAVVRSIAVIDGSSLGERNPSIASAHQIRQPSAIHRPSSVATQRDQRIRRAERFRDVGWWWQPITAHNWPTLRFNLQDSPSGSE